jgi:predicted aspartyl protease
MTNVTGTTVPQPVSRRDVLRWSGTGSVLIAAALSGCSKAVSGPSTAGFSGPSTASADRLFQSGMFDAADAAYLRILAKDPADVHALIQRGNIALLANRLAQAQSFLARGLKLAPGNTAARQLLGMTLYRADAFDRAAPLYRETGHVAEAALLASFANRQPYDIVGPGQARIPFVAAPPPPSTSARGERAGLGPQRGHHLITGASAYIAVSVNGLPPEPFGIDTGTTGVAVSPGLAEKAALPLFGTMRGIAAGGLAVDVQLARIDSLRLGAIELRNVPGSVSAQPSATAQAGRGKEDAQADQGSNSLGTNVLCHFLATLDYPGRNLILRSKSSTALEGIEASSRVPGSGVARFWLNGYAIEAEGAVNGHGPVLLTMDTGWPGQATLTLAAAHASGFHPATGSGGLYLGGVGGTYRAYPFEVPELALGTITEHNVEGTTIPPGPAAGFTIAGSVGAPFFRPYAVTIDTVGMRLFMAKTTDGS